MEETQERISSDEQTQNEIENAVTELENTQPANLQQRTKTEVIKQIRRGSGGGGGVEEREREF